MTARGALLAVCCALTACGGPKVIRETSEPKRPAWVDKTPASTGATLFFTGATSGAPTLEEGKNGATAHAFDQASRFVGVRIVAEGTYMASTEQAGDTAKEKVKAVSAAQIRGAEAAATYYERTGRVVGKSTIDRYDVWVLVKLPRAEVERERKRQADEKSAKGRAALQAYSQGKTAEDAGDLEGALGRYHEADEILAALDEGVDVGDPAFKSSRELHTAVRERSGATLRALRRVMMAAVGGTPTTQAGVIAGVLTRGGYDLVSAEPAIADKPEAALEKAKAAGAKVLVALVEYRVSDRGKVLGQPVAGCTVVLRAIEVATGKVVSEISHESKGFGQSPTAAADDAGREAGKEAAKKLLSALQSRWGLESKARADR